MAETPSSIGARQDPGVSPGAHRQAAQAALWKLKPGYRIHAWRLRRLERDWKPR